MNNLAFASLLATCALTAPARADVVVLNPNKDNTLYESAPGGLSNALGPEFYVGRANNTLIRRGLIAFDVSSVPPGSTVNSVSLAMLCTGAAQTDGQARIIGLHMATADWGEGTSNAFVPGGSGAAATAGDATWIHTFFSGSTWTNAGADFVAAASATTSVLGPGTYTWNSTAQLVADVQGWVNGPASSFGWVVLGDESANGTGRGFSSREGVSNPALTIDFTPPPPITTYCTGKTATNGCIPFLTTDPGSPSISATGAWNVRSNDMVDPEAGFGLFSFKKSNLNFHGGKLCVKAPLTRTPVAKAKSVACVDLFGGCTATACRQLRRNMNVTIQNDTTGLLTAGQVLSFQMLQRDPADPHGFGDNLSDGVRFTIAP